MTNECFFSLKVQLVWSLQTGGPHGSPDKGESPVMSTTVPPAGRSSRLVTLGSGLQTSARRLERFPGKIWSCKLHACDR